MNLVKNKSVLFFFVLFNFSLSDGQEISRRQKDLVIKICSITMNSGDEISYIRKKLNEDKKFKFIELSVLNQNPNWFEYSCYENQKESCDILLISGHFAGYFWGSSTPNLLLKSHLENVVCQNLGSNLFSNLKGVFLFGCNTAVEKGTNFNKAKYNLYLKERLLDNFSINEAMKIAESLYCPTNLGTAQYFSSLFYSSPFIYGFSGKSPKGSQMAFQLDPLIKWIQLIQEGVLSEKPKLNMYNGYLREITEIDRFNIQLICPTTQFELFSINNNFNQYYSYLIKHLKKKSIEDSFNHFLDRNPNSKELMINKAYDLINDRHVSLSSKISLAHYILKDDLVIENLIETVLSSETFNYLTVERICESHSFLKNIDFKEEWLHKNSDLPNNSLKYNQLISVLKNCFKENLLEMQKNFEFQLTRSREDYEFGMCVSQMINMKRENSDPDPEGEQLFKCLELQLNQSKLKIDHCIYASQKVSTNSKKKSDLIWYCWSKLKNNGLQPTECLKLSLFMPDYSNKKRLAFNCRKLSRLY